MTPLNPDWPLTGFIYIDEEGVEDFIHFHIYETGGNSGEYTDWEIRENTVETHIPGTNITVVESLGFYPATVTHLVAFDNRDDYYRFCGYQGQIGTLRIIYGTQNLRGEVYSDHLLGFDYELLDNVRIADIGSGSHKVDGKVECRASFSRAVDPLTRLAVIA